VKQSENTSHPELVGGASTTLHNHPSGGGGLVDKAGVVTTSGGEADVSFNTNYVSTDYFILLTPIYPGDGAIAMVKTGTKTVSGFTLNILDDSGKTENTVTVFWATGGYSNP